MKRLSQRASHRLSTHEYNNNQGLWDKKSTENSIEMYIGTLSSFLNEGLFPN